MQALQRSAGHQALPVTVPGTRAPELLRNVHVCIKGEHVLPRTLALFRFLCARAPHVRELDLAVIVPKFPPLFVTEEDALEAAVASCLGVCGAAGCLEELCLSVSTVLDSLVWLPDLKVLRKLTVIGLQWDMELPEGVSGLTALKDLQLVARRVSIPDNAILPPSITKLTFHTARGGQLPNQIFQLTNLVLLQIAPERGYEPSSLEALAALPHLRGLMLQQMAALPPCLSLLAQLTMLSLTVSVSNDDADIEAALGTLRGLRRLLLLCQRRFSIPAFVTRQTQLERLDFDTAALGVVVRLPPGPWLASLRWAALPWATVRAAAADGTLHLASSLEYLSTKGLPCPGDTLSSFLGTPGDWEAFWSFVATHPPLRLLGLEPREGTRDAAGVPASVAGLLRYMWEPSLALLDALLDLQARRPQLRLRRSGHGRPSAFRLEVLAYADGMLPPAAA